MGTQDGILVIPRVDDLAIAVQLPQYKPLMLLKDLGDMVGFGQDENELTGRRDELGRVVSVLPLNGGVELSPETSGDLVKSRWHVFGVGSRIAS